MDEHLWIRIYNELRTTIRWLYYVEEPRIIRWKHIGVTIKCRAPLAIIVHICYCDYVKVFFKYIFNIAQSILSYLSRKAEGKHLSNF